MAEFIVGYRISARSKEDCIYRIIRWLEDGAKRKYFVCANPHTLQMAKNDSVLDEAIRNADLVTPDGVGIVIASKIFGGSIKNRVTGSDIFWGLNHMLNQKKGFRVFFLGSTEETLRKIREKMSVEYPEIRIAGMYSPPFKHQFSDEDNRLMIEAVNNAQPDVLWVGMTAPKQEKWIYENRNKLNVKFVGAIGAVFDFYSGNVKRSHPFFQEFGLEWLPRLLRQPRRLWRRNFISSPFFLLRVLREKGRQKLAASRSSGRKSGI